jgi:hypothetical protein
MDRRARRQPQDRRHRLRHDPFTAVGKRQADVVDDLVEV